MAGRCFTVWATREAYLSQSVWSIKITTASFKEAVFILAIFVLFDYHLYCLTIVSEIFGGIFALVILKTEVSWGVPQSSSFCLGSAQVAQTKFLPNAPKALIVEPSRELAEQTLNNVKQFKKYIDNPKLR